MSHSHTRETPLPASESGLVARHLSKSYRGRTVVKDVSLAFNRREAIGLLGPNGAGKTTSFYMITGLVTPDSGQILLDGQDVSQLPMYRRARMGIGYLPQEASIFRTLSVEANIMSILEVVEPDKELRHDRLENLLKEFSVTHVRKSAGGALSGGERRRVEIARALASDPSFILLDEPFAGIDPIAISDIRDLVAQLKERGLGVLITDHNVRETLGIIDRAVIMHDGNVLTEGTADEIVDNDAVRAHYLGDDFTL
jgi:lipopolysaccharide export system ATP-binding protein